jgi:recombination protein RecT
MENNNFLQKASQPKTLLTQMIPRFADVLPEYLSADRFVRLAIAACNKNHALAEALADPKSQNSVISAMIDCATAGLELDDKQATIVCFYNKRERRYDVTFIPMYQGFVEIALRDEDTAAIYAGEVCENDEFDWDTGRIVHHRKNWKKPGPSYVYYCRVTMKNGICRDEVMSIAEIEAIRDSSSGYRKAKEKGNDHPWISKFPEMAKKTVFRRAMKWLKKTPALVTAINADDNDCRTIDAEIVPEKNTPSRFEAPAAVEVSPVDDIQRLQDALDADGIPLTAEEVKEYMGDKFNVADAIENRKAIADRILMGNDNA